MSAQRVLNAAYDATTNPTAPRLRTTVVGAASAASTGQTDERFDVDGIWERVYDSGTNTVRVVDA